MQPGSNELVRVRGHVWSVLARTQHGGCEALRLRGVDGGNAGTVRTFLSPFDRVSPIARPAAWRRVGPRRWLHALRRAALDAYPFGGLRTTDESRIRLLPYQLEPALAILRQGATRVLIADEVGLGKTIQAGLILSELSARADALRAIVVMPAGLREQWRDELRGRFGLAAAVADAIWLASATRELPAGVNPWSLPGVYLASYDFVKRPEVLRPLEDVTWDLVVLDEAHAAAIGTDRRAAADAVAARARHVVLLTATPHNGDDPQFEALCAIGRGVDSKQLMTFQRSRAALRLRSGQALRRRTVLMVVRPSPAERRMHRILERYTSQISRESACAGAMLAAIVLRKRSLSSAASLQASAARRQALLSGLEPAATLQLALPLGDEDPLPDDVADETMAAPGLHDAGREQRVLSAVVRGAREAAARETKAAFLIRFLRRVREPVIVFTEYRDTLARLARALEAAGLHPQALHGGMPPDERGDAQRAFNASGTLLLATDAAAEGLNLHHRCRIVVHYELPWSPVRLQQRTGRVDRIGQDRRVHEILLVAGDTAERLVLARLARRLASASGTTAGSSRLFESLTESRVAAAVLDGRELAVADAAQPRLAGAADDEGRIEADLEAQRLLERRRWFAQSAHGGSTRPLRNRPLAVLKRPPAALARSQSVLIVEAALRDAAGQAAHAELVPVALADGQDDESARRHLERRLQARLAEIAEAHRRRSLSLEQRDRAIAAVVPRAAQLLVQAGLFDRRAVRASDARRRAAGVLVADAEDRIGASRASRQLAASFEVVARLVVRRP